MIITGKEGSGNGHNGGKRVVIFVFRCLREIEKVSTYRRGSLRSTSLHVLFWHQKGNYDFEVCSVPDESSIKISCIAAAQVLSSLWKDKNHTNVHLLLNSSSRGNAMAFCIFLQIINHYGMARPAASEKAAFSPLETKVVSARRNLTALFEKLKRHGGTANIFPFRVFSNGIVKFLLPMYFITYFYGNQDMFAKSADADPCLYLTTGSRSLRKARDPWNLPTARYIWIHMQIKIMDHICQ